RGGRAARSAGRCCSPAVYQRQPRALFPTNRSIGLLAAITGSTVMVPNEGLVFVEVRAMATTNPQPQSRIFMSYRRDETDFPAGWLYDRLAAHFGHDEIFKDGDAREPGDDFGEVIARAVGSCDVLLALIGEYWVSITDSDGKPRLDDPDDFVRLEIEAALQRGVRVIPILVGDAAMPRADQLPETLRRLGRRAAVELDRR